jgi:hypothetical protein
MEKLAQRNLAILSSDKSKPNQLIELVELNQEIAVKFGRFLLKEATHKWDKDRLLCWQVKNKEYDTLHLFEKFVNEVL